MSAGAVDAAFVYDRIAYPAPVLPIMTPQRLGAAAILQGRNPPPSATCSMLEIGCGDGLNLIGMAAVAPAARFVGFDLSHEAIERGRAIVHAAGLANVHLHVGDIMDYPRDGERFDYVVTHGLYTWVPAPVRPAILELTAARLAPGGIAYISYDCLPAAGAKAAIGAFVNRCCGDIEDFDDRVLASVRLIATLARHQVPGSRLDAQLKTYAEELPNYEPGYIFHDVLAEHYAPVSLRDLANAAAPHGLAVIGDAGLTDLFTADFDPEALELLDSAGRDVVARYHAIDMLRGGQMFRRSLLCRADSPAPAAAPRAIESLWFGLLGDREEVEIEGRPALRFSAGPNIMMMAAGPPRRPVLEALWAAVPGECTIPGLAAATALPIADVTQIVGTACAIGLALAYDAPPFHVAYPGERPRAGHLIRTMLARGDWSITLRHARLMVPQDAIRALLGICDGTRTRAELASEITAASGTDVTLAMIEEALEDLRRRRVFEA